MAREAPSLRRSKPRRRHSLPRKQLSRKLQIKCPKTNHLTRRKRSRPTLLLRLRARQLHPVKKTKVFAPDFVYLTLSCVELIPGLSSDKSAKFAKLLISDLDFGNAFKKTHTEDKEEIKAHQTSAGGQDHVETLLQQSR